MNALDLISFFLNRSRSGQQGAANRLENRFNQADRFQGTSFQPTIADLMDYQTATGSQWPKAQVPESDQMRMREQIWGDPYAPVNVPSEVIAQPKTTGQMVQDKARNDALGEIMKSRTLAEARPQQWQTTYDQLGQFARQNRIDPNSIDRLGSIGIKQMQPTEEPETWTSYTGPGGSLLRKSQKSGKVESVLGRKPQGIGGQAEERVPEYVKQAQQVILKFAQQGGNPMAMMVAAMNPELMPMLKEQMSAGIPEQFKPIFDNAMAIVQQYYAGKATDAGANDPLGIR